VIQDSRKNNRVANCKSNRDNCLISAAIDFGVEFTLTVVGGASVPIIAGGLWQMYKLGRAVNSCESAYGQCHEA
jgi:hypothetical protein